MEPPLQAAVLGGREPIIWQLLDEGADVNAQNGLYGTALQAAAFRGHRRAAEILLKAGADMYQEGFSRDALHAASEAGHSDLVQLFLNEGYRFKSPMTRFWSPPMKADFGPASANPYPNVLRDLSDNSPYPKPKKRSLEEQERTLQIEHGHEYGQTRFKYQRKHQDFALGSAASGGHVDVVKLLISKIESVDISRSEVREAFKEACSNGHVMVAEALWFDHIDRATLLDAVKAAASNGHVNLIMSLVNRDESLITEEIAKSVLVEAADHGQWRTYAWANSVLKSQVGEKNFPDVYKEALLGVAEKYDPLIMRAILDDFLGLSWEETERVLIALCINGSGSAVEVFVEHPKNESLKSLNFTSAIQLAAWHNNYEVCKYLINNFLGRNGTRYDPDMIIHAAANGHVETVRLLCGHGMDDVRPSGDLLNRCLQVASACGHVEVVRHLLREGAETGSKVYRVERSVDSLSDCSDLPDSHLPIVSKEIARLQKRLYHNHECSITPLKAALSGFQRFHLAKETVELEKDNRYFKIKDVISEAGWKHGTLRQQEQVVLDLLHSEDHTNAGTRADDDRYVYADVNIDVNDTSLDGVEFETGSGSPKFTHGIPRSPASASRHDRKTRLAAFRMNQEAQRKYMEASPVDLAASYCSPEFFDLLLVKRHLQVEPEKCGKILLTASTRQYGGGLITASLKKMSALPSPEDPSFLAALKCALSFFGEGGFYGITTAPEILETGPARVVRLLLEENPHIRTEDPRYNHILQICCAVGDIDFARLLISKGSNVNHQGFHCGTSLQAASRFGNLKTVQFLIQNGADTNVLGGENDTAVRAAVVGGHLHVVQCLIHHGCNINVDLSPCKYRTGYRPRVPIIDLSLETNNAAIVELLITKGADLTTNDLHQCDVLTKICRLGYTGAIEKYLERGLVCNFSFFSQKPFKIGDDPDSPLYAACSIGDVRAAELLLKHGAKVERGRESTVTPLAIAAAGNHLPAVSLLLKAGAKPNRIFGRGTSSVYNYYPYSTPLAEAAARGHEEVTKELLRYGATVSRTPDVSCECRAYGTSINIARPCGHDAQSYRPVNALHRACDAKQSRVVKVLLHAIRGYDSAGAICNDAITRAVENGDTDSVKLLLEAGASSHPDDLRRACALGWLDIVKLLLTPAINVNTDESDGLRDSQGKFKIPIGPLIHIAAGYLHPDIVQYLIEKGADVKQESTVYGSPLSAAFEGLFASIYQNDALCADHDFSEKLPYIYREIAREQGHYWRTTCEYKGVSRCHRIVKMLFDAGATFNHTAHAQTQLLGSALQVGAYVGSESLFRCLLDEVSDVNIYGGHFGSPLHAAQRGNSMRLFDLLLERGADINYRSPRFGFVFHHACQEGTVDDVRHLIQNGADSSVRDEKYDSILAPLWKNRKMSKEAKVATLNVVISQNPSIRISEYDLLDQSYMWNTGDELEILLRQDPSVKISEEGLIKRITVLNKNLLPRLLQRDGGIGTTPAILKASMSPNGDSLGNLDVLLKHRPICKITHDILTEAAGSPGAVQLMRRLLDHDPKASITGSILERLIQNGRSMPASFVEEILERNPEIKVTDALVKTSRNCSADPETTRLLVKWRGKETFPAPGSLD